MLHIVQIDNNEEVPFHLLRLADPSMDHIHKYIKTGICYIAQLESNTIGTMVLDELNATTLEIKNIAIAESHQRKGFGRLLLQFANKVSIEKGYKYMTIGTGNSSTGQLALYQKEGFEISRMVKNYFLDNYSELIFESGIQCKHLFILTKSLESQSDAAL